MMRKVFALLFLSFCSWTIGLAQSTDDPVLFKVNNKPVHVSEFTYIYDKTNGNQADYSKESLTEYLDLYTKFKLKVERAREMKLDTVNSLNEELAGYRRQLADSYLMNKEVTDKLVREAYDRKKQDVDISHILISIKRNPTPTDTAAAWQSANQVLDLLKKGSDFETVAKEFSSDKSVKNNGGHIGYVTALFPHGYYHLENAAYSLPLNKVHGPIRTDKGYHILKIHDRRPARGEMEVGHILVRKSQLAKSGVKKAIPKEIAKAKIDSIYKLLEEGYDFEKLAKEVSDDKLSAIKGGYLGFFGINKYERAFEDAAFSLSKDKQYTKPVETSIGWHIIRRISKRDLGDFKREKLRLEGQIKKDSRFETARTQVIDRIKEKANYSLRQPTYSQFVNSLGEEFGTYKWRLPKDFDGSPVLFTLGDDFEATIGDFGKYLRTNSRDRIRMGQKQNNKQIADALYAKFLEENVVRYEEANLEKRYPEFKALMREYEEGILLFEATKMEVWDKASKDSVGLAKFFETVKDKHVWKERARVSIYTLKDDARNRIDELVNLAKASDPEVVKNQFMDGDRRLIRHKEETFEKGKNEVLDKMNWKVGEVSKYEVNPRDKSINFFKIEEVIPAGNKSLNEARGYVIAEYQDQLEKQWIEELKKKFPVEVDQKVFKKLIKRK